MTLDLATLLLTLTSVSVIAAFVMFVIWRINRDMAGVFQWMLAAVCIGMACVAILVANQLPLPPYTDVIITNSLSLTAVLLVVEGALRFRDYPSRLRWRLGLLLIPVFVIMAWVNRDNAQARLLFHDPVAIAGLLIAAVVMYINTTDRAERLASALISASAFLMAAGLGLRWFTTLTTGDPALAGIGMLANPLLYFMMILFSISWTFGVSVACYFRAHRQVMHLAREDVLTGLPNRRSVDEILGRTILESRRSERPFAVIILDVNGFRQINDRHGHSVGDEVLAGIAGRLKDFVRDADFTGRLGGDEFIIVAFDVPSREIANITMERLRHSVDGKLDLSIGPCDLTVSAGMAFWPQDGDKVDELLRMADRRMHRDKARIVETGSAQDVSGEFEVHQPGTG